MAKKKVRIADGSPQVAEYFPSPKRSASVSPRKSNADTKEYIRAVIDRIYLHVKNITDRKLDAEIRSFVHSYEGLEPVQHTFATFMVERAPKLIHETIFAFIKQICREIPKYPGMTELATNKVIKKMWERYPITLFAHISEGDVLIKTMINRKITRFSHFRNHVSRTIDDNVWPYLADVIEVLILDFVKNYPEFENDMNSAIDSYLKGSYK